MIRHVVLCRFRADVDAAARAALDERLAALCESLPNVLGLVAGPNVSPEGLGRGFDHAFVIDFVDAAARDVYLEDEMHRAFGADLVAALEGGVEGLIVYDIAS